MANDFQQRAAWIGVATMMQKNNFVGRHSTEGGFTLIELLAAVGRL